MEQPHRSGSGGGGRPNEGRRADLADPLAEHAGHQGGRIERGHPSRQQPDRPPGVGRAVPAERNHGEQHPEEQRRQHAGTVGGGDDAEPDEVEEGRQPRPQKNREIDRIADAGGKQTRQHAEGGADPEPDREFGADAATVDDRQAQIEACETAEVDQ